MADTHPNAYKAEAMEKRTRAIQLNNEADVLEAKAEALDPTPEEVMVGVEETAQETPTETDSEITDEEAEASDDSEQEVVETVDEFEPQPPKEEAKK